MTCIYMLRDPFVENICYIGITRDPKQREHTHWHSRHLAAPIRKNEWLRSLQQPPIFHILRWVPNNIATNEERKTILIFAQKGYTLMNAPTQCRLVPKKKKTHVTSRISRIRRSLNVTIHCRLRMHEKPPRVRDRLEKTIRTKRARGLL